MPRVKRGVTAHAKHKKIIDHAETLGLDQVYVVGDDFLAAHDHNKSMAFKTIDELIVLLPVEYLLIYH